jgi:hypothetical protein
VNDDHVILMTMMTMVMRPTERLSEVDHRLCQPTRRVPLRPGRLTTTALRQHYGRSRPLVQWGNASLVSYPQMRNLKVL